MPNLLILALNQNNNNNMLIYSRCLGKYDIYSCSRKIEIALRLFILSQKNQHLTLIVIKIKPVSNIYKPYFRYDLPDDTLYL